MALDHYARLCEGLLEAGVAPVVTFHHFTTPLWLADQGGWETIDARALRGLLRARPRPASTA